MATSRKVARSLRKSATRISGIQDSSVAEAAEATIEHAIGIGGRFFRGRVQMYAEVVQKRSSKRRSSALVWPKPAAAWVIRSYGRGPVAPVRKTVLRAGTRYFPSARAAGGDGRWEKVKDEARDTFPDIAQDHLREALDG